MTDIEQLARKVEGGDRRALARAITLIESTRPDHRDAAERLVARLMAAGKGNAVIARELFLSTKTVRNHVSNILRKLQVADRAQAINLFRDSSG